MHRPKPLQFDKRKDKWVENPIPRLQEWANKDDDYHAGFLVGIALSGALSIVVYGVALCLSLL